MESNQIRNVSYYLTKDKRSIISPIVLRLLSKSGGMTREQLIEALRGFGFRVPRTTLYDMLRPRILEGEILRATQGVKRSIKFGRGRRVVWFVLASFERSFLRSHPGYKILRIRTSPRLHTSEGSD